MPTSPTKSTSNQLILALFASALVHLPLSGTAAVTTGWNYEIKFDDAHGFASAPIPADIEGRAGTAKPGGGTWTGDHTTSYDLLKSSGGNFYSEGTDGKTDFSITTRVLSNTGAWSRMNATRD